MFVRSGDTFKIYQQKNDGSCSNFFSECPTSINIHMTDCINDYTTQSIFMVESVGGLLGTELVYNEPVIFSLLNSDFELVNYLYKSALSGNLALSKTPSEFKFIFEDYGDNSKSNNISYNSILSIASIDGSIDSYLFFSNKQGNCGDIVVFKKEEEGHELVNIFQMEQNDDNINEASKYGIALIVLMILIILAGGILLYVLFKDRGIRDNKVDIEYSDIEYSQKELDTENFLEENPQPGYVESENLPNTYPPTIYNN